MTSTLHSWMIAISVLSGVLSSLQTPSEALLERSRQLYGQAVRAYDKGSNSEALRLARLAMEANPKNAQASKLLMLLGSASTANSPLAPLAANTWLFEEGDGRIDSFPEFFHLSPSNGGGRTPRLVYALPFPRVSTQWEVEFRMRAGVPRPVPGSVSIADGERAIFALVCYPSKLVATAGDRSWNLAAANTWRTVRLEWRQGTINLFVDGVSMGSALTSGIPGRLSVGSTVEAGKGTEIFFELTEVAYQQPQKSVGR